MKNVALVVLDCVDGFVRRYNRVENNKPIRTGEDRFTRWIVARNDEPAVAAVIQDFRTAWTPPEPPAPHPTSPLKTAIAA